MQGSQRAASDDEGVWEDEPDADLAYPRAWSSIPFSQRMASRRRRDGGKTIPRSQPSSYRRTLPSRSNQEHNPEPTSRSAGTVDSVPMWSFIISYTFDIARTSLRFIRMPLAICVAICVVIYLLSLVLVYLGNTFLSVLSPLCWLPGVSSTPFCYIPRHAPDVTRWADYPSLVQMQKSRFEQLLDESVGSTGISLDIKRAEMATSDLITLVSVSDFQSREMLARHLKGFVADAKRTGRGLQTLSSRIAGAVDKYVLRLQFDSYSHGDPSVMAVNDYALHTIEQQQSRRNNVRDILWPFFTRSVEQVVRETFAEAMSVVQTQIARLIIEAEISLKALNDLEERLKTLSEFVVRENNTLTVERDELLGALWTMLGGNKRQLKHVNGHIFLLNSIGEYRRRAAVYVSATVQTLRGMSEDMEDLRRRVAAPELVGDKIPVEVHLRSIKIGLERLQADRDRTKAREEEIRSRMLGVEDHNTIEA